MITTSTTRTNLSAVLGLSAAMIALSASVVFGAADLTAYCDATLAIETAPFPELELENADDEELAAALASYRELVRPLADEILAVAPEEIAADLDVLSAAIDQIGVVEGDPFADPEVVAAEQRVHAFDAANCGWQQVSLTAIDYHFTGELPTTTGATNFDIVNEGDEFHVAILGRKLDTIPLTAEEAFAASENDEQFAEGFEFLGEAEVPPGSSGYLVVDLTPGEYVLLCPVPVGSTETEGSGPPHFVEGMVSFFTVVES
jgi:hypothetical protein